VTEQQHTITLRSIRSFLAVREAGREHCKQQYLEAVRECEGLERRILEMERADKRESAPMTRAAKEGG
jgi:hypothetical protein